ncbi:DUF6503 family protein [Pontibacter liquoris]|uniref:DUF6503 family protein n=1 Tax=Pontibacter liquoris TaxID=2905677 RepID=UPI001FA7C010|nr:DUF6503 family protein [Pontibacter liquoris]
MKNSATFFRLPAILGTVLLLILSSCGGADQPDARQLISQAVQAQGGQKYNQRILSFSLDNKQYRALNDSGAFVYSRTYTDTTGQRVYEVLRNSGFTRKRNEEEVLLPQQETQAAGSAVLATIQMAMLPYLPQNPETEKAYLGEATLHGEPYYKVLVTTQAAGLHPAQEYLFWLHQQRHTLDYVASRAVAEGEAGQPYFGVAVNARQMEGIRFQDYQVYVAKEPLPLENYARAYEAGKLVKVTETNLENISVKPLN